MSYPGWIAPGQAFPVVAPNVIGDSAYPHGTSPHVGHAPAGNLYPSYPSSGAYYQTSAPYAGPTVPPAGALSMKFNI